MFLKAPPNDSLNYERRLHHRAQYLAFFKKNEVIRLRSCRIFRIPNDLGHFRLGMTLKIRASSVQRNRIKRAVRESMRSLSSQLGSYDYNVVIQPIEVAEKFRFAQVLYREITLDLPKTPLLRKKS